MRGFTLCVLIGLASTASSFTIPSPSTTTSFTKSTTHAAFHTATKRQMMADPSSIMDTASTLSTALPNLAQSVTSEVISSSSNLLSFSDQGQNLAGIFFQASLLPYLVFLYFLQYKGNQTPALGNFGFQFLLLFVISTIPSGIVSKSVYGTTLADCDWLHGGAEALLTVTNILIVLGFRSASTKPESEQPEVGSLRTVAFGIAALFFSALALGPSVGFEGHSPFLFGTGALATDTVQSLPFVSHAEPVNALSLPTWAIHFSSVFEFLFAMGIIWDYAKVTGNEKWKGMTWGMIPSHASGLAACTYHFFYNDKSLQFVVTTQAGLTLLGNITLMIAAIRIALSNGWTFQELNPFKKDEEGDVVISSDSSGALVLQEEAENELFLAGKLIFLTLGASYIVKYGELGLNAPFADEPSKILAILLIAGPAAITASVFANKSKVENGEEGFLPSFGSGGDGEEKKGLSMEDVKKYGISGTVAYILTELAFWAVAFPVASTALYQSTGHWPDVINDSTDRTTVLGFIFAGANIARLLVPLRLGAALALAPWVDENIINRDQKDE